MVVSVLCTHLVAHLVAHLVVVEARDWKSFQLHEMVKALLTRQMHYYAVGFGLGRGLIGLQGRYTGIATGMSI